MTIKVKTHKTKDGHTVISIIGNTTPEAVGKILSAAAAHPRKVKPTRGRKAVRAVRLFCRRCGYIFIGTFKVIRTACSKEFKKADINRRQDTATALGEKRKEPPQERKATTQAKSHHDSIIHHPLVKVNRRKPQRYAG